jgi:hypothetical protein
MPSFAFSEHQRAVVRALGEALFHHQAGPTPGQLDTLVAGVEAHLQPVSRPQRTALLLALLLVRWLPVLLWVAPDTFEAVSVPKRLRILERMDRSKALILLMPLVAFKTLFAMLFFEQPAELRAMGYPGDDRKRWRVLAAKAEARVTGPAA